MQKEGFAYENLERCCRTLQFAGDARASVLEAVELFHAFRERVCCSTDTRRVVAFIVCEGLGKNGLLLVEHKTSTEARTRHSLRASTIRSPRTNPQPVHIRSPVANYCWVGISAVWADETDREVGCKSRLTRLGR
jgi:hypothetical protein